MKYFQYISRSKVEMLFPQVPHSLREKVSAEIGFNLGVVSGKLGSAADRFENVVTQLQTVERYLEGANMIGTVAQPRDWFSGEMLAKTVGLWTGGGAEFFVGQTAGTIVALGGSVRNLLGGDVSRGEGPPNSNLAPMLKALEDVVISETTESASRLILEQRDFARGERMTWRDLVRVLANNSRAVATPIQFVAWRLLAGQTDGHVVLATPLYVASGVAAAAPHES